MQQKNLNASRGPYGTYEELEIQMGENRKKPQKLKLTKSKIKSYDAKKKGNTISAHRRTKCFRPTQQENARNKR